jgi:hypothetical protein
MAAHADGDRHHTIVTRGLYIKTGTGVLGPYRADVLRDMIRKGILPKNGAVSVDGELWRRADSIKGLFTANSEKAPVVEEDKRSQKFEKDFSASEKVKAIVSRICRRRRVRFASNPITFAGAAAGCTLFILYVAYLGSGLQNNFSWQRLVVWLTMATPAIIAAIGLLESLGNILIAKAMGMDETERRFLALHLPRNIFAKLKLGEPAANWVYHKEWMLPSAVESPTAYIHVFHDGDAIGNINDEVGLWNELKKIFPYEMRELCIPGQALRQIQHVKSLPKWASTLEDITDGYALAGMLDNNYSDWARNFLERGRKRLGLNKNENMEFYLTCLPASNGRTVLAVCVIQSIPDEDYSDHPSGYIAA